MEDFTQNTSQNSQQPSGGRPVQSTSGQTLGIAALITAIVTFVLAVIPCVGIIAMIPGIIAIVLATVGLSQASRNDSPRGLLIAGLIIGVVASVISFSQIFIAGRIADKANRGDWGRDIENVIRDVQENVIDQIEDANVSIKVESNGDKVEITTNPGKSDRVQELEELEEGNTQSDDTTGTGK